MLSVFFSTMYMLERIHDEYGQSGLQPKRRGKLTYLIQAHTSSPSLSSGTLITLSIKENLALDEQNLSEHSRVRPPWGALDWLRPQFRFEPQTRKFEDH